MWSFFSRDPVKDFPYEVGEAIDYKSERCYWSLHKGKKKVNGEDVTIFILDVKNASQVTVEAAKTSVKRLKTLRHPSIVTFLDSAESDKAIYLATENVLPLEKYLEGRDIKGDLVSWGLFQVTRGLSFLINDGNLRHNSVNIASVFVNTAGEWKLGSVDYVSSTDASPISGKVPSILHQLDPPEIKSGSKLGSKWSMDAWGLGCLIWEVFNRRPLRDIAQLRNIENIPKTLGNIYNELTNSNPTSRPNPADVIAKGRRPPGGFFKNDLVDTLLFLEEIQIKEQNEKSKFFNGLPSVLDKFPEDICRHKVLPQLITAFEFGNAGSSVLIPLFKLGKLLEETEYQLKVVPCVVKLFSSTDRMTRVKLLQQLDNFADHLQPATVNDKIFPNVITGFMDTSPVVREHTVKAMLHLAPKLNFNNLNVELLKHFARLQVKDDQGGIRTNTTICLGKIACYLNPQTRRKILIPAFTRVFQDTFPQAKIAGIMGLAATQQYYLMNEIASKVLPPLCTLTCDSDKSVRDTAFKTIKGFLGKLEKLSEDPTLLQKFEVDVDASAPSVVDSSTWAGWAVSLTSKFQRSQSSQSVGNQPGQIHGVSRTKGRYNFESSSSTSTTSSIPSTPSGGDILQPPVEGQESTTDYDDDWDNEDCWGAIDGDADPQSKSNSKTSDSVTSSTTLTPRNSAAGADGWDTWAIDETDERDGWDDYPIENKEPEPTTKSNAAGHQQDDFFGSSTIQIAGNLSDWSSSDNDRSVAKGSDPKKLDEMRLRREERKLHRQNELQAKKASKAGPLKLGVKKINLFE